MENLRKIAIRTLSPGSVLVIALSLLSAMSLSYIFISGQHETIPSYVVYAVATYSITLITIRVPKIVMRAKAFIYNNTLGNHLLTDAAYRVKTSLYLALTANIFYAVFKLSAGAHYAAFWFSADALYYTVLSVVQFFLLRHMRKGEQDIRTAYKKYRFCSGLLFILNTAMAALFYKVATHTVEYSYPGFLIYVMASYTFFCLIHALISLAKYRKLKDPVLSANKMISLAKALSAIFALQTAMFSSFGSDTSEAFRRLMNILTGSGMCIIVFCMASYMVIKANRNLKMLNSVYENNVNASRHLNIMVEYDKRIDFLKKPFCTTIVFPTAPTSQNTLYFR